MKNQGPQGKIRKLILHFNIDKTIVMRDSLVYNNTDFLIRQIITELMWGKPDVNKAGEEYFKVEHKSLEFDKNLIEPDLICYSDYLSQKYGPISEEEYNQLENKEKSLEEINKERELMRLKMICDVVEPNNPGVKFKKTLDDMKKKLRLDEKIYLDLGLKLNNAKPDENNLRVDPPKKFIDLDKSEPTKEKFRTIFINSYHKIIISFFTAILALKKIKQDFAIVFRFFGHEESDIEEFIYEFNCFCNCLHPRYCGDYGYNKVKFDVEKEKKLFTIDTETKIFTGVSIRGDSEENEKLFFGTFNAVRIFLFYF
ncbi:MAG: hypothetical protein MJ252_10690 [archaeon]|nr:hypothetical protein [archaeon]